jgi:hypothetical protein
MKPRCPSGYRGFFFGSAVNTRTLLTLAFVAAATCPAAAETPAGDTPDAVELSSGAFFRGLVLEVEPGDHLVIRLPSGEERRLPWGLLKSATRSGNPIPIAASSPAPVPPSSVASAPAPPSAVASTPAPPSAAASASPADDAVIPGSRALLAAVPGPRIRLDVDANMDGQLQRLIGVVPKDEVVGYNTICTLPCVVNLPAEDPQPYRIGNPMAESTEWFKLPPQNARVRADMVQRTWALWAPAFLVGASGTALAGGITWLAQGAETDRAPGTGVTTLGIISGACLITAGIFALVVPETSMTIEPMP